MAGKTLDELEGVVWDVPAGSSRLVITCQRLRSKPIDEFSVEDLRIMISQGIGPQYLVPQAVAILGREPLAEGDYYPGDLLVAVIGAAWLQGHADWLAKVIRVVKRALHSQSEVDDQLRARLI